MDCASCVTKVTRSVESLPGVSDSAADATAGRLRVRYDAARVGTDQISTAIRRAGYTVADGDEPSSSTDPETDRRVWTSPRAVRTWISAGFLGTGFLLRYAVADPVVGTALGGTVTASDLAMVAAVAVAGLVIVRNGYYSLRQRSLDMDLLMGVAVLAATAVGLFVEAATLTVLFSVSELLERYSVSRARSSLRELIALSPDEATVRRDRETRRVPVEAVGVGETVLVEPGEKIPMDGVVRAGGSAVDQSPITGESVPVDKGPGDEVYAGTVADGGYLEVEATSLADETTLARIIDSVDRAAESRTERERFVDRFAGYYTPTIVVLALLAATVPPLGFGAPWQRWFLHGIALLVIACPCAFVISTPVTVVSGITSAARNGVLIDGGRSLEAMGEVRAVALDKTGTLTTGDLEVTDVVPLNGADEPEVLRRAAALERRSEHPIGDAIVARAEDSAVETLPVDRFEALTGLGVRGTVASETYYVGSPSLFADRGFDLDSLSEIVPRLQADGKTVVLVGRDGRRAPDGSSTAGESGPALLGLVAVADTIRPGATAAVERLHELGVERVVVLTGDNVGAAGAVADAVGVDDYRADLLPDGKVDAVEALVAEYGSVAMVGDGVNDAPALAAATVGVAMGAAGTDTATEAADVALMGDDLADLPYLYDLSRRATGVIRQNVWSSLGVKLLLALGVPFGLVSVALAVVAGDAGMTTAVTANALRLAGLSPGRD